jgi:hypothetical protein
VSFFIERLTSLLPPFKKTSQDCLRCEIKEIEASQQLLPKLPGGNTCTQKMLNCLILLITKGAALRMRKTTPCEPVCFPAAIVCNQPEKEFALPWSPSTPNQLAWFKMNCPMEESLIS